MDLLPTDEQIQIVDSVVEVLKREFPTERHRGQGGKCTEPNKLALRKPADLGWFSMGLEEDLGGLGYGLPEEALLFTEIGRYVGPMPILGSVLGVKIAAMTGHEEMSQSINTGAARVGIAIIEDVETDYCAPIRGDYQVVGARECDVILFVGRHSAALLPVDNRVKLLPQGCFDNSASMATVQLNGIDAVVKLSDNQQSMFHQARVLISAMLLGLSEAARDMAVEYAKVREQFNKPIGSFQAVKHPCAEAAVRSEMVRSQLWFASLCAAEGRDDADFQVAAMTSLAIDSAHRNCRTNIQVHGAIGGTDEHEAQILLKRSHLLANMFGPVDVHLADALVSPID